MKELRTLAIAVMTVVCALVTTASSQVAPDGKSKPAPNAWMLTPTPYLEWNKGIAPSVRAARDEFWDSLTFREVPITSPASVSPAVGGGPVSTCGPEIRDSTNRAIATASFTSHRSVLSASEFSMYTELTLHVDEVLRTERVQVGWSQGRT